MRSFEDSLSELKARGVRVAAISVDAPEVSRDHALKRGYSFPFLSDPNAEVIRAYDLLHEKAGPEGQDVARPAEFLVDPQGFVRWVNLSESVATRARPAQVIQVVDELKLSNPVAR